MRRSTLLTLAIMLAPAMAGAQDGSPIDSGDTAWLLTSSLLVLMMSLPGLALFYGGLVHKDNILATLMQTFTVACVVSLFWPIIGYSLAFSEGGMWLGGLDYVMLGGLTVDSASGTIPESVFIMFQMTFAIITTALLMGSVADRIKFSAILLVSILWMIVVYAPIAHWVWGPGGAIGGMGLDDYEGLMGFGTALDFAGGTVVHISSGIAGLVAALVLGKRLEIPATSNNVILSLVGACFLWVGWFGFNAGSAVAANGTAGMAMLVTNSSAAAAALCWIMVEWIHKGKPSVVGAISGMVAGLVAITPAAGFVTFASSVIIGLAGGFCCYVAVTFFKDRLGYDDSLDVFGIHGVGGIVGAILTGVYAAESIGGAPGLLEGNSDQLMAQIIGVVVVIAYTAVATWVILKLVQMLVGLRVDEQSERGGLDMALHGEHVKVYK